MYEKSKIDGEIEGVKLHNEDTGGKSSNDIMDRISRKLGKAREALEKKYTFEHTIVGDTCITDNDRKEEKVSFENYSFADHFIDEFWI